MLQLEPQKWEYIPTKQGKKFEVDHIIELVHLLHQDFKTVLCLLLDGTFRGPLPADSLPHHDEVYPPLPSNSCIFVCSCNDGRSDKCIRSWAWLSINTVSTTQTAGKSGISRLDPETGFQLQGIEARYEDKLPFGIVSSDLQEHIPCLLRT